MLQFLGSLHLLDFHRHMTSKELWIVLCKVKLCSDSFWGSGGAGREQQTALWKWSAAGFNLRFWIEDLLKDIQNQGVPSWPCKITQVELEQLMALTVVQKLRILEMWHLSSWNYWQSSFCSCLILSVGDKLDKLKERYCTCYPPHISSLSAETPDMTPPQTGNRWGRTIGMTNSILRTFVVNQVYFVAPIWQRTKEIEGFFSCLFTPYFLLSEIFLQLLSHTQPWGWLVVASFPMYWSLEIALELAGNTAWVEHDSRRNLPVAKSSFSKMFPDGRGIGLFDYMRKMRFLSLEGLRGFTCQGGKPECSRQASSYFVGLEHVSLELLPSYSLELLVEHHPTLKQRIMERNAAAPSSNELTWCEAM